MSQVQIERPKLNDEELAVLASAPHSLSPWSNVAGGHNAVVFRLWQWKLLEPVKRVLGRGFGSEMTVYDLTPEGRNVLASGDAA